MNSIFLDRVITLADLNIKFVFEIGFKKELRNFGKEMHDSFEKKIQKNNSNRIWIRCRTLIVFFRQVYFSIRQCQFNNALGFISHKQETYSAARNSHFEFVKKKKKKMTNEKIIERMKQVNTWLNEKIQTSKIQYTLAYCGSMIFLKIFLTIYFQFTFYYREFSDADRNIVNRSWSKCCRCTFN